MPERVRRLGRGQVFPGDEQQRLAVAWEELTPTEAAHALGLNPTAFRVRLLRRGGGSVPRSRKNANRPRSSRST